MPDLDVSNPDRGWLLELATDLQKTLDLSRLLSLFTDRVDQILPLEGVEFEDRDGESRVQSGQAGEHTCRYDVVLQEETLGRITFSRSRPFSREETEGLETLLLHLVYPLRNALMFARVQKASAQDPLTGLGNRSALDATLDRELSAANRHGDPLSLIMLDVDHFKRVNDRHGHLVGDEILRELAAVARSEIRDCDIAFRYGGEEFVIVLPKTDLSGAELLAHRIRQRVADNQAVTSSGAIQITISLGVATLEEGDGHDGMLARADRALYRSKAMGRNRVSTDSRADRGLDDPADSSVPRQA